MRTARSRRPSPFLIPCAPWPMCPCVPCFETQRRSTTAQRPRSRTKRTSSLPHRDRDSPRRMKSRSAAQGNRTHRRRSVGSVLRSPTHTSLPPPTKTPTHAARLRVYISRIRPVRGRAFLPQRDQRQTHCCSAICATSTRHSDRPNNSGTLPSTVTLLPPAGWPEQPTPSPRPPAAGPRSTIEITTIGWDGKARRVDESPNVRAAELASGRITL